jgi:hypothetical protein
MIRAVLINKTNGDAVYCLECKEYRSSIKVQLNFRQHDKSTLQCSECNSRNVKELQPLSTGLKARTETLK